MSDEARRKRRALWLVAGLVAYATAVTVLAAVTRARTWDYRALEQNRLDSAWELELIWLTKQGALIGRDLHYARGPLWQLVAWLPTALSHELHPGAALGGMEAAFLLLGLGVGVAITLLRVPRGGWQPIALSVLAALAYGAGISTCRAFFSAAIVLFYLPNSEAPSSFRRTLAPAALTLIAALISFDRLLLSLASVGAIAGYEWVARWRRGETPRLALVRLGHFLAVLGALLAGVALLGLGVGIHPVRYFFEQREIAAGYGGLGATWAAGVRIANILAFLAAASALGAVSAWLRGREWLSGAWLFGALPAASFALVIPDQGHVYVALAPLVIVLVVVTARQASSRAYSLASGLLASLFVLGWFGAHPGELRLAPWKLRDALGAAPERGYATDVSHLVDWVEREKKLRPIPCLNVSANMTVVHALTGVGGPTLLSLRWTALQRQRLARGIADSGCPFHLLFVAGYDNPTGAAWALGEDFFSIASHYRPRERLGPTTAVLERVNVPRAFVEEPLGSTTLGANRSFRVPGELAIPLDRAIDADDVVTLDYALDLPRSSKLVGALPVVEYRFERDGRPLADWLPLFHLELGPGARAFVAPLPEAAESAFLLGRRMRLDARPDLLRLRFAPRGRLSPSGGSFRVDALHLTRSGAPPPTDVGCEPTADLSASLASGASYARNLEPKVEPRRFRLDPNQVPDEALAEVFFPLVPCSDSCVAGKAELSRESGDGAEIEAHVIDGLARTRSMYEHLAPGAALPFELSLADFGGHPVFLRLGSWPAKRLEGDYLYVSDLRLERCGARQALGEALAAARARVVEGSVSARGDDVVVSSANAEVRYPVRVVPGTCLALDARGTPGARVLAMIGVDDVDSEVFRAELGSVPLASGERTLFDFNGRAVELVVRVEAASAAERVVTARLVRCSS